MGATWSNFSLVASTSGTGAGTLTLSGLQKNDIVIAATACWGDNGELPSLKASGIPTTSIFERNSVPMYGYWRYGRWYYYYYYYWHYYWWYWRYYYWWYYTPMVTSRVGIWRVDNAGDITVNYSEPSGYGHVFQTYLVAWRPNITVGANEAIKEVSFVQSAQAPSSVGNIARLPITQDDLIVAMGTDTSTDYSLADIDATGVGTQQLLDFFPKYASRSVRIKVWRATSTGEGQIYYHHCYAGRMASVFKPNVKVVQTAYPTVTEPYAYVEIHPELTSKGRVLRPKWFDTLRTNQNWATNFGLRKRWTQQSLDSQEDQTDKVRIIEMWKVDADLVSSIPVSEAHVYGSEQEAEDRVTALDEGW